MKRIMLLRVGLALSLIVLLAGCSSASAASTIFDVTMTGHQFTPATLDVPSNAVITVNLINKSSTSQTWTVMLAPVKGAYTSADAGSIYFDSGPVAPGTSKLVTFTTPTVTSTYPIISTAAGQFQNGMVGKLTVR